MKTTRFLFPLYVVAAALAPLSVLAQGFYQGAYDPSAPVITGQPISPAPIPPPPSGDVYATPFNPGMQPGVPSMSPGPGMGGGYAEDSACGLPGVYAYGELLFWEAHFPYTPYTMQLIPATGALQPRAADFDSSTGYRVGAGWRFIDGWDVGVSYTDFDTSGAALVGSRTPAAASENVFTVLNAQPNIVAGGLATQPGNPLFLTLTADEVRERLSIDYQVLDFEAGRKFCICRTLILRPFGGVRFANLEHQRSTTYADFQGPGGPAPGGPPPVGTAAGSTDTYSITEVTDIDAVGLRGGGRLSWNIGASGLQVFTRTALSLLYADFTVSRTDSAILDINGVVGGPVASPVLRTSQSFDKIVPVFEIAAGIRYELRGFFVSTGFEFQNWFNVIDEPRMVSALPDIAMDRGDIGLGGWFVRAGYNF